MKIPKILIIGGSGAGKSAVADLIANKLGVSGISNTSDVLIEDFSNSQNTPADEIIANKNDYREQLLKFGISKQKEDPSYPVKECLSRSPIVTGIRTRQNFEASKHLFDIIVWISRPGHNDLNELSASDADEVINNDDNLDYLEYLIEILPIFFKLKSQNFDWRFAYNETSHNVEATCRIANLDIKIVLGSHSKHLVFIDDVLLSDNGLDLQILKDHLGDDMIDFEQVVDDMKRLLADIAK